ncbi:unnamed protein product [Linum tenue]|uniref:Uncharacterized protein n=1 Tax=Linum tenue TaxID=586396 RepID=A0AAV0MYR5_9ROSI|nr:unnamed protein product [Linum tenue]
MRIKAGQLRKWEMSSIMPWYCWHSRMLKWKMCLMFFDAGSVNLVSRKKEAVASKRARR